MCGEKVLSWNKEAHKKKKRKTRKSIVCFLGNKIYVKPYEKFFIERIYSFFLLFMGTAMKVLFILLSIMYQNAFQIFFIICIVNLIIQLMPFEKGIAVQVVIGRLSRNQLCGGNRMLGNCWLLVFYGRLMDERISFLGIIGFWEEEKTFGGRGLMKRAWLRKGVG